MNMTNKSKKVFYWATSAIVAAMLSLLYFSFRAYQENKRRDKCLGNQRVIADTIVAVAMAYNWSEGDMPDIALMTKYFRKGTMPICPSGGKYVIPKIPEMPYCTIHGKLLSKSELY